MSQIDAMKKLRLETIEDSGQRLPSRTQTFSDKRHLGGNIGGGDPLTFYPELWRWLVSDFKVKAVMDIGCAEGINSRYFETLGCKVIGVEGLLPNALHPEALFPIILLDFNQGFVQVPGVDLCWCCEVLEHVDEENLDNLMQTLLNGRIIAITFAVPGQGGHHHVNEQREVYWLNVFKDYGCNFLEAETVYSRKLAHAYYAATGLIFENTRWQRINRRYSIGSQDKVDDLEIPQEFIQRINLLVANWRQRKKRVVIYGAGHHTQMLLKRSNLRQANIVAIADRMHSVLSSRYGYRIISAEMLCSSLCDVILISSRAFQDEIAGKLNSNKLRQIEIVKIY